MASISEISKLSQQQLSPNLMGENTMAYIQQPNVSTPMVRADKSKGDALIRDLSKLVSGIKEYGKVQYDLSIDATKRMAVDHISDLDTEISEIESNNDLSFDEKRQMINQASQDKLAKSGKFLEEDEVLQKEYDNIFSNKAKSIISRSLSRIDIDEYNYGKKVEFSMVEDQIMKHGKTVEPESLFLLAPTSIKEDPQLKNKLVNSLFKRKIEIMQDEYISRKNEVISNGKVSDKYLKDLFGSMLDGDKFGINHLVESEVAKMNAVELRQRQAEAKAQYSNLKSILSEGTTKINWIDDNQWNQAIKQMKAEDRLVLERKRTLGALNGNADFQKDWLAKQQNVLYQSIHEDNNAQLDKVAKMNINNTFLKINNGQAIKQDMEFMVQASGSATYGSYIAKELSRKFLKSPNIFKEIKDEASRAFFGSEMYHNTIANSNGEDSKILMLSKAIIDSGMDTSGLTNQDFELLQGKGLDKEQKKNRYIEEDINEQLDLIVNNETKKGLQMLIPSLNALGKTELIETLIAQNVGVEQNVAINADFAKVGGKEFQMLAPHNTFLEMKNNNPNIEEGQVVQKVIDNIAERLIVPNEKDNKQNQVLAQMTQYGMAFEKINKQGTLRVKVKTSTGSYMDIGYVNGRDMKFIPETNILEGY